MTEPIDWLADGTPYSPRFGDRYHSEHGGLDQARQVFLAGCGLPAAWAHQAQWRILETGFGLGLNFLVTWAAWRADPARPQRLHFVSCEAWPVAAGDEVGDADGGAARGAGGVQAGEQVGLHRVASIGST